MDTREATLIVEKHFSDFKKNSCLVDFDYQLAHVHIVSPSTDISDLARVFAKNFAFFKRDEHDRFIGLDRAMLNAVDATTIARTLAENFKDVVALVSVNVRFIHDAAIVPVLLFDGVQYGGTDRILDSLTASSLRLMKSQRVVGSDTYEANFENLVGGSMTFSAKLEAICNGSTLRDCKGNATYVKNGISTAMWHPKAEKAPIVQRNGCCSMDFAFALAYGLSDVNVTYSNGDFKIEVGSFSTSIYSYEGSLSDCCPASKQTVSTTEQPEKTCASEYPNVHKCEDLPFFDLDSFEELEQAVRDGEALPEDAHLTYETQPQRDSGPCPGQGSHYDFYYQGRHVGSGFDCPCCEDTEEGPKGKRKYQYNG